jgi:general stress protein 26
MTRDEAIDIVRDAGFGYLSTTDGDQPHVRPMMPYLTEDNELLLALLPRSRTIEHVTKNPKVELCFVDRKMSYCRISGKAAISSDADKKSQVWGGVPMLRQYFTGPEDPNFHLAVINIEKIEAMTPHQKSPEFIAA